MRDDEEDPDEAKDLEERRRYGQRESGAGSQGSGVSGSGRDSSGAFRSASGSGRGSFHSASSRGIDDDDAVDRSHSSLNQRLLDRATPELR
jgi:hypothetical protein